MGLMENTRQERLAATTREQRRQHLLDNWSTDFSEVAEDTLAEMDARAAERSAVKP